MKHILLAAAMGIITSAAGTGGMAAASHLDGAVSKPPCVGKVTKIHGHQAAVNCGPATVTLSLSGRTYDFKNGHCVHDLADGLALELDLGIAVVKGGASNAGEPYLAITAASATLASLSANYGGRQLVSDSLIKLQTHGLLTGTFKSSFTLTTPFTGTWDCHGALSAY